MAETEDDVLWKHASDHTFGSQFDHLDSHPPPAHIDLAPAFSSDVSESGSDDLDTSENYTTRNRPAGLTNAIVAKARSFKCSLRGCEKKYGTAKELSAHEQDEAYHTPRYVQLLTCETGNYLANNGKDLQEHRVLHNTDSQTQFYCPEFGCQKFSIKEDCVRHLREDHGLPPHLLKFAKTLPFTAPLNFQTATSEDARKLASAGQYARPEASSESPGCSPISLEFSIRNRRDEHPVTPNGDPDESPWTHVKAQSTTNHQPRKARPIVRAQDRLVGLKPAGNTHESGPCSDELQVGSLACESGSDVHGSATASTSESLSGHLSCCGLCTIATQQLPDLPTEAIRSCPAHGESQDQMSRRGGRRPGSSSNHQHGRKRPHSDDNGGSQPPGGSADRSGGQDDDGIASPSKHAAKDAKFRCPYFASGRHLRCKTSFKNISDLCRHLGSAKHRFFPCTRCFKRFEDSLQVEGKTLLDLHRWDGCTTLCVNVQCRNYDIETHSSNKCDCNSDKDAFARWQWEKLYRMAVDAPEGGVLPSPYHEDLGWMQGLSSVSQRPPQTPERPPNVRQGVSSSGHGTSSGGLTRRTSPSTESMLASEHSLYQDPFSWPGSSQHQMNQIPPGPTPHQTLYSRGQETRPAYFPAFTTPTQRPIATHQSSPPVSEQQSTSFLEHWDTPNLPLWPPGQTVIPSHEHPDNGGSAQWTASQPHMRPPTDRPRTFPTQGVLGSKVGLPSDPHVQGIVSLNPSPEFLGFEQQFDGFDQDEGTS